MSYHLHRIKLREIILYLYIPYHVKFQTKYNFFVISDLSRMILFIAYLFSKFFDSVTYTCLQKNFSRGDTVRHFWFEGVTGDKVRRKPWLREIFPKKPTFCHFLSIPGGMTPHLMATMGLLAWNIILINYFFRFILSSRRIHCEMARLKKFITQLSILSAENKPRHKIFIFVNNMMVDTRKILIRC